MRPNLNGTFLTLETLFMLSENDLFYEENEGINFEIG